MLSRKLTHLQTFFSVCSCFFFNNYNSNSQKNQKLKNYWQEWNYLFNFCCIALRFSSPWIFCNLGAFRMFQATTCSWTCQNWSTWARRRFWRATPSFRRPSTTPTFTRRTTTRVRWERAACMPFCFWSYALRSRARAAANAASLRPVCKHSRLSAEIAIYPLY